MIIAIDGPAASGKGTLARKIGEHYGLAHLDTGALYRAVALSMLRMAEDPNDAEEAAMAARNLDPALLEDPEIRHDRTGKAASIVAAMPEVRAAILEYQRKFALSPPGGASGAVLDGRDIGTVVCPDADVKFFVTADVDIRTRRRFTENQTRGEAVSEPEVRRDLIARDERDAHREISPLQAAEDATLLDTTKLSIEAAFAAAREVIDGS